MEYDQPSVNLLPGVYCGTFTLKNATHAYLADGMYVMKGGPMKIEGDSILEGDEVTFYFTGDPSPRGGGYSFEPFSFSSNAQAILSAPSVCTSSGLLPPQHCVDPYFGILFYVDPLAGNYDDEFTFESNTGTHYIEGTVYMPNHVFNVESSSRIESEYLLLVVRRFIAESNSYIDIGTNFPSGGLSPLRRLALVE